MLLQTSLYKDGVEGRTPVLSNSDEFTKTVTTKQQFIAKKTFVAKPPRRKEPKDTMPIATQDVRRLIREVLGPTGLYTHKMEELLVMTAAVESNMGSKLYQYGTYGVARGIFQMEPATERDIWGNYLKHKPELRKHFEGVQRDLTGNLHYQILMARIHYLRDPHHVPAAEDTQGLAEYYKRVWNTHLGKSTVAETLRKYKQFK